MSIVEVLQLDRYRVLGFLNDVEAWYLEHPLLRLNCAHVYKPYFAVMVERCGDKTNLSQTYTNIIGSLCEDCEKELTRILEDNSK